MNIYLGSRKPVFQQPQRSLSDFLNTEPSYYENVANKGAYENVEFTKTSATKDVCIGIARGVEHLHQVINNYYVPNCTR
jgi:hypothetical protein